MVFLKISSRQALEPPKSISLLSIFRSSLLIVSTNISNAQLHLATFCNIRDGVMLQGLKLRLKHKFLVLDTDIPHSVIDIVSRLDTF